MLTFKKPVKIFLKIYMYLPPSSSGSCVSPRLSPQTALGLTAAEGDEEKEGKPYSLIVRLLLCVCIVRLCEAN